MSELQLRGHWRTALTHMTMIGLAAILEEASVADVRVGWTRGLDLRPVVWTAGVDFDGAADIVHRHALQRATEASWLGAVLNVHGRPAGLMSPRIAPPEDRTAWQRLADGRAVQIDALIAARARLDLMLVGALGAPSYWHQARAGDPRPDQGASRWEMKTRNRGEDFIRHRLLPIAHHVAGRDAASIRQGLEGMVTLDVSGDNLESRTATGLAGPGLTDTAAAWCGLWAISQFPVVPLLGEPSRTAGQVSPPRGSGRLRGWLCVPMSGWPMTLPRLRSVIVSGAPERIVRRHLASDRPGAADLEAAVDRDWLRRRGVGGIAYFGVQASDNPNAPELRTLDGVVLPLEEPHAEQPT